MIALLDQHESLHPNDLKGLGNAAIRLSQAGHPMMAASVFRRLLERFPDNWLTVVNLAVALDSAGKVDEATELAEKAVDLQPSEPIPWLACGNIYLQQRRYELALDRFRKCQDIDPAFPRLLFGLGTAMLGMDRPAEAEGYFREELSQRPDDAITMSNLGASLVMQERFDEAEPIVLDTLRRIPKDAATICNLARIYESRGRNSEALDLYRRALRDDPEYRRAQEDIDRLQAEHPDA